MAYGTSQTRDAPIAYPQRLSVSSALGRLGFDLNKACRGSVIVRMKPGELKRYAFRYRVGDGHAITRWGRLSGAEWTAPGVIVFELDRATP